MINSVVNSIENLKHNTISVIEKIQESKIPGLYPLKLERREEYYIHGQYFSQWSDKRLVYVVENLPYTMLDKTHIYNGTAEELINTGKVHPFIIFLNKSLIKLSDIQIIYDCKYTYMMINNLSTIITDTQPDIDCIMFPFSIVYTENATAVTSKTKFIFSEEGKLINDIIGNKCVTIDIDRDDFIQYQYGVAQTNKSYKVSLDTKYELTKSNFICFKNGLLCTSVDIRLLGLNIFSIKSDISETVTCLIHYFKYADETKNNINQIPNKQYIIDTILSSNDIPSYISRLNIPFDFKYSRYLTYEENLAMGLDYIMRYNSALMNGVYKDASNIESREYKGDYIKSLQDKFGYVTMSRKIGISVDNYVMIFVNGNLYNHYNELVYKNKDFKFPVIGIEDTDIIEFMYFKKVDNRSTIIRFDDRGDDIHIIDPSIKTEDIRLFCSDSSYREFNISRDENIQFEFQYTLDRIDDTHVKIIPSDSFYYNRKINMVSSRQFRYFFKGIKDECVSVKLSSDFIYCNDKSRYLVFINGKKINRLNYKITIPGVTLPFDDISVYFNIPLKANDKVEVFYVPGEMDEIDLQPTLASNGVITIDKTKIDYNFNKYVYLIFINGKKIKESDIIDMTSNKVKIIANQNTTLNISIIKHVQSIDILSTLFSSKYNVFDDVLDSLSQEEIDKLYPSTQVLSNAEPSIIDNTISMKSVMYEVIKKYWMRPSVYSGGTFLYDFDDEMFDKDENCNVIIDLLNPTVEDKLSIDEDSLN